MPYGYYGSQADPGEMQQMSGNPFYNPMQPGPDWVRGIQYIYGQMNAEKEKKKQEQLEAFARDLDKRLKEAQIFNLMEPNRAAPIEKPVSKVSAKMVKTLMGRLDYPEEAISEVDTMNDLALRDTWAKLQSDFASRSLQGMRIPKTATTPKGRLQYQRLKVALDTIKSRKKVPEGVLIQLQSVPEKAALAGDTLGQLQEQVAELERQEGEIASMMNSIDETGELNEEQLRDLNLILKWKVRYRTTQRPIPKTEAEKKLEEQFPGAKIINK